MNAKTTGLLAIGAAILALAPVAMSRSVQHLFAVPVGPADKLAPGNEVPPGPAERAGQGAPEFAPL